jgi:hypothetical protein
MKWAVMQRMKFIERHLLSHSKINRSDISEEFNVSVQQASKDLSFYRKKAPGNIWYNNMAKAYYIADKFEPQFITEGDAVRYCVVYDKAYNQYIIPLDKLREWEDHMSEGGRSIPEYVMTIDLLELLTFKDPKIVQLSEV